MSAEIQISRSVTTYRVASQRVNGVAVLNETVGGEEFFSGSSGICEIGFLEVCAFATNKVLCTLLCETVVVRLSLPSRPPR